MPGPGMTWAVSMGENLGTPEEITFEVTEVVEGGYDARALGHSIITQGGDWDDLNPWSRVPCCATLAMTLGR